MIEQQLVSALMAEGIKAHPLRVPQDEPYPSVSYQVVYDGGTSPSNCNTRIGRDTRVQVDVFAKTYEEAKAYATRIRSVIEAIGGREIVIIDAYENDISAYREIIDFKYKE